LKEKKGIDSYASQIRSALQSKQGTKATGLWSSCEGYVGSITGGINWYNILQGSTFELSSTYEKLLVTAEYYEPGKEDMKRLLMRNVGEFYQNSLYSLMNGEIKKKLKVIPDHVSWGGQSARVFSALSGDFMNPVVSEVDYLLNSTNLHVAVYTGQLDLIVDTLGTLNWMDTLKANGMSDFHSASKKIIRTHGKVAAFKKANKNLSLYMILAAGHMIPSDQPETAVFMLNDIIQQK
jgi:serine carboxypeptidase 1